MRLFRCAQALMSMSFTTLEKTGMNLTQSLGVVQLAQTTMRSELGKITLDKTFEERAALNDNIVKSIQCASLCGSGGQGVCTRL